MKQFGAQVVVYEDSGFLSEAVWRIYPFMKKIVFLVGQAPWNGVRDPAMAASTIAKICAMPDPDKKFIIISKYWATEAVQRNEGLDVLFDNGCDWCLVLDDDEMYNRNEMSRATEMISNWVCTNGDVSLWLLSHLIYWKNRQTVISDLTAAMPVFVSTDKSLIRFSTARCVDLSNSVFMTFAYNDIIMHHLSYVRSNEQIQRKMATFSHAGEERKDWFQNIWMAWTPEMTNLHPNPGGESTFARAIPSVDVPFRLEPLPTTLQLAGVPNV